MYMDLNVQNAFRVLVLEKYIFTSTFLPLYNMAHCSLFWIWHGPVLNLTSNETPFLLSVLCAGRSAVPLGLIPKNSVLRGRLVYYLTRPINSPSVLCSHTI